MAALPPLTAMVIPFMSAVETWFSPVLSAYVPFLSIVQTLMHFVSGVILSFQAFDLLSLVFPVMRLKSGPLTGMINNFLPRWWKEFLPSTLSTQQALGYSNSQTTILHPTFTNTMSFTSNILNSIDNAYRRY
ncbi:hypothetical protein FHG87_003527, partial [Trinorchestia longiramus]